MLGTTRPSLWATNSTSTPAHDVSPQPRSGQTARHPPFGHQHRGRESHIAALIDAASTYHPTAAQGQEIADRQVEVIRRDWVELRDEVRLTNAQRDALLGGPILNPYAFQSN